MGKETSRRVFWSAAELETVFSPTKSEVFPSRVLWESPLIRAGSVMSAGGMTHCIDRISELHEEGFLSILLKGLTGRARGK